MARTTPVAFRLYLATRGKKGEATMRGIGLVLVGLAINTFAASESQAAASNAWCATYSRPGGGVSENCGYATLGQCRAQVLGLGGWCRPNPFPGTAFGTSGTWSSGPPRQKRRGYYGY
jgi:hypothetical protein